jgi:preprotein translocase subunit SecF
VAEVQETFVGPTWGQRITTQSLRALIVFLIVVARYISFRLDRKMAAVAMATMAHDVLLTIGLYALVGFTVSPATVIAILTILGYSLYDTVVIFDRVKDNAHTLGSPGVARSSSSSTPRSTRSCTARSTRPSARSSRWVRCCSSVARCSVRRRCRISRSRCSSGCIVGAYSSVFVAGPLYAHWKAR